jgi:GMP synthase-like glutamine amidotransferase
MSTPGLIFQHGEHGPPALVADWLQARGLPFVVHHVWQDEDAPMPDTTGFQFVVTLGSKQSVSDTEPVWVPREIAALREAVAADVPILGLCFGAQALSAALGGGADPLPRWEIGWFDISMTDGAVPPGPWLQYHSELMRVPAGARELARSPAGSAVFRSGPHVAVQFHPEVDTALVDVWASHDPTLPEKGVSREHLATQSKEYAPGARARAFALFDRWLDGSLG